MTSAPVSDPVEEIPESEIRFAVGEICGRFPDAYWRDLDRRRAYPEDFVAALTEAGWLSILIPRRYGGGALSLSDACIVLEEINASGGNAAACHAQMYTMGSVLRHGSEEQKERFLPPIASGDLRLQGFAITEPDAGSDTTSISTVAKREGDVYVVNGQKVFTSRLQHSDLMLLLARTTPHSEARRRTEGLSLFIVDLRDAADAVEVQPIPTMVNHETNNLFIHDLVVPASQLIGQEGEGFKYVLDGMNAERILLASESVGDGRWFCSRGSGYASHREVFGRPIGQNQGVQFPLAHAYASVMAADLMRRHAAGLFDQNESCGAEANMAKLLASEAAWEAANACLDTHGGYGFAEEFDVERKFREARLYMVAPVSNNLILAYLGQHVLGMPKSY
jgi:acyl-CoA dehydrogenase